MRVAILGAGFCGLAAAWFLGRKASCSVTVFDPLGIGKGASGVAAGLLHPYGGLHSKKNPRADIGMTATLSLIQVAEEALNSNIIIDRGLVRVAMSSQQKESYAKTAALYSDVHWLSAEECQKKLGTSVIHPGVFIDSAVVVDCEKYLQGLWKACSATGTTFEKKAITSLSELRSYDKIIVTMGAASNTLPELASIKIAANKGQVLELEFSEKIPLPYPVSSQVYLLRQPGEKKWIAGATYERNYRTAGPDIETAATEIIPKLQSFLRELPTPKVVGCRAGLRASTPDHMPLIQQIDAKSWVLTGMGSKGLLYHALYADELTSLVLK